MYLEINNKGNEMEINKMKILKLRMQSGKEDIFAPL